MLKAGLTGGIGSGKSVVAKLFRILGIPVFDADAAARQIMHSDVTIQRRIVNLFGNEAYRDGELNRSLIAASVFSNPAMLNQLNAIVHPATIAAAENWMKRQDTAYTIKEAALIFESSGAASLDFIIGVFAPVPLRIKRVMQRDDLQPGEVKSRMQRQIDDAIKMKLCNAVIVNDEQQPLIPQVLAIHEKLLGISATQKA